MAARWCRLVLALSLLAAPSAEGAALLELALGPTGARELRVEPGSVVSAVLRMSGVPTGSDGRGLFGMGFSLGFDAAALSASTPVLGPLWAGKGFADARIGPGEVAFTANRFSEASGPSGDGIALVSLSFRVLAEGRFELALGPYTGPGDNVLYDGTRLDEAAGFFLTSTLVGVPEPGTLALLGLGFAILAGGRRGAAAVHAERPGLERPNAPLEGRPKTS